MRLAAVTPAYNEETLIRGCVECLKPFVERHIILVSEKPYYGKCEEPDRTADIAESLGAEVIRGQWPLDHMQRNTGISLLKDFDWIITTDVDMWVTKDYMTKLINRLGNTEAKAFITNQYGYWKDIDHILIEGFKPVIAIKPSVRFSYIGNIDTNYEVFEEKIHHLAWCEPKNIYKKVLTYSHAPEFDGETWYRNHYQNWVESDTAVLPDRTYKVEKFSLPQELRAYI